MFNFSYEDGLKINNNYFPAISRVLYHSTETISQPPQSHETIPLIKIIRKDPIYLNDEKKTRRISLVKLILLKVSKYYILFNAMPPAQNGSPWESSVAK
jgi:hypothetical protein